MRKIVLLVALLIVALLLVGCKEEPTVEPTKPPTTAPTDAPTDEPTDVPLEIPACLDGLSFGGPATVVRIKDGDTVIIRTPRGEETINYVGIDANDEPPADFQAANEYNRQLVEGKQVELVQDPNAEWHNKVRVYYVFTDEAFVNAEMIAAGHARLRSNIDDLVCGEYFKDLLP